MTHSLSLVQTLFCGSLSRWLRLETIAGSPPSSPAPIEHRHGHHRSDPSLLAPPPFLSLSARATAVAWPYPGVVVACRRPTTAPSSLSLSSMVVVGAGAWRTPLRRACSLSRRKGLGPFLFISNFFFVLFWLGLITHSTKTANPTSQPPILTRSLNDLLSTIRSQIFKGLIR